MQGTKTPSKNRIVDANALITAGEKYDVQFLVKVCIKMLETKLDEKNEFRDLFLSDLDDEATRKKAVLAIKAIRAEQNKSVKTMAKNSGIRTWRVQSTVQNKKPITTSWWLYTIDQLEGSRLTQTLSYNLYLPYTTLNPPISNLP